MPQNDMRDMGRDLALSDPFMQIGQTIAKVGEMVQSGEVPQPVRDAYDYITSHLSSGGKKAQDALRTLTEHVSQNLSAQESTPLLSNRQGPEQPSTPAASAPKSRTLSEDEFNGIRQKVLEDAPNGLDEAGFNRYIAYALPQAIGTAENMPPKPEGSATERFLGGAAQVVTGPLSFAKGMVTQPLATLGEVAQSHMNEVRKARQAGAEGRYSEMVGHGVAAVIPGLGPMAAQAGEQIASGDVAGGLGTGTAALAPFAADAALSSRATTPAARAAKADLLRRGAEEQVAQKVLAPANPRLKGTAQALAPDILERGLKGGRLELQQLADAGMHDAGVAIDAAVDKAGGLKAPVSPTDVITALKEKAAELMVGGKAIVGEEGRLNALNARIRQLQDMGRQGTLPPYEALKRFRDSQYRLAEEAKGYERAGNAQMADEGWAAREAGSAVRDAFAKRSPETAAANAEYTFWKSLDKVLDPTQGRPKATAPTSGVTGGERVAGAVAGSIVGKPAAFVMSVVVPWLRKVTAEPSWQLADASRKMQLAKAIETGNQGLARTIMLNWAKYSPKQTGATQVGPYRVEPQ